MNISISHVSVFHAAIAMIGLSSLGIAAAWAEESKPRLPQQGTTSYATYYTAHAMAAQELGKLGNGALVEVVGITRNTEGKPFFDNMSVRCLAYRQSMGGKPGGGGNCIETDSDGDQVYTTFDYVTATRTLVGGTGKYEGISGTAPFTRKNLPAPGPGSSAVIVDHKVTWQISK